MYIGLKLSLQQLKWVNTQTPISDGVHHDVFQDVHRYTNE